MGKLLVIPLGLSLRSRHQASCSGHRETPLHLSPVSDVLELGGVPLGLTNRAGDKTRDGSGNGETPLPSSRSHGGELGLLPQLLLLIPLSLSRRAGDEASSARHGETSLLPSSSSDGGRLGELLVIPLSLSF